MDKKKLITDKIIQNSLNNYNNGKVIFLYFLLIPIPLLLSIVTVILAIKLRLLLLIIPAAIIISGLLLFCIFFRPSKTKNDFTYCITEDLCIEKMKIVKCENPDEYIFILKDSGKFKWNLAATPETNIATLFDETETGDKLYLVMTNNNKIRVMFSSRHWEIGNEFIKRDGVYSVKQ